jgi:hypothetical protein
MKFKLDENLPVEAANLLKDAGHDAHSVHEEQLRGAADSSIARVCQREQRILITLDLDFAAITTYRPPEYFGIIVLAWFGRTETAYLLSSRVSSDYFGLSPSRGVSGLWTRPGHV